MHMKRGRLDFLFRKGWLTTLLLLNVFISFAQKTVNGVVVSASDNMPLIGVNIVEKGTTNGTVTDMDGKFSISVADNAQLLFSYIGYIEQTLPAEEGMKVLLKDDTQSLEEIVVVGYGAVKKKDLTGAVSSVRRKDMGDLAVSNVEQMIQGRVAGVEVINNSGLPGSGTSIKIRGVGTLYNSDPLYIIDGMPGDINSVSQYDIESIEILKDASSTAIYGARAANGVVLVTTKKGRSGKATVNLNAYVGVAQAAKKIDMLNASQYIDLALEMNPNFFKDAKRFVPTSEGGLGYDEAWARTDRNNMQDEIFRLALQQEYHMNISGGSDNAVYSVSGSYTDQDAITEGYNYKRLNILANNEFTIRKYVKVGQNLTVRRTDTDGVTPDFTAVMNYAPYMPVEDAENSWGYSKTSSVLDGGNDSFNPITMLNRNHSNKKSTFIREQVYLEVSFLDMFKWRTQAQYTNSSSNDLTYNEYSENGDIINKASINDSYSYSQSAMIENYLNFTKEFGVHSINAMIGNSFSSSKYNNGRSATIAGSASEEMDWENMEVLLVNKTPKYTVSGNNTWHSAYLSYYGRINYSLMDKYLLTFNYRQDASPNFSPSNRWGRFPSLALAWKIDEENFMQSFDDLSQLKLRLSVGRSGNDRIASYAYLANLYSGSGNNIVSAIGVNQGQAFGVTINGLPATDIRWETTTSYNLGVDAGFFNNALTASLDVYTRQTDGILVKVPIPGSSGIDQSPYQNAAEVENKGFDFSIGYNKQIGDFGFSASAVVGFNDNKVLSLGAGEPISMASQTIGYLTRTEVGHSIGEFYGYQVDKVLSTTAEANAYNEKYGQNAAAGDIAFKDIAGPADENGNPTGPDGKIDDNDRTFIGNPAPKWNYGLNINANYKNFDMQLGFTGVAGNKIFDFAGIYERQGMRRLFNQSADILDRWQEEGDVTDIPRAVISDPNNNLRVSDRYIKDGSYLRLKNFTVGYTVPFKSNEVIDKLRFYVTAQNLFTITKYDGYDPEISSPSSWNADSYNLERGIVTKSNMLPIPRTFLLGVQATF